LINNIAGNGVPSLLLLYNYWLTLNTIF